MRSPTRAGGSGCRCTWPTRCRTYSIAPSSREAEPRADAGRLSARHEQSEERVHELLELVETPVSLETPVGDGESLDGD